MSKNLTGRWIGQYRYPEGSSEPGALSTFEAVSFTVHISDSGGAFSGELEEDGGPPSTIRGMREGGAITFSKRYSDTGGGRFVDRILYEGGVNDDATRIDGNWMIPRITHSPGAFFMMREKPQKQEEERTRTTETV